MRQSESLANLAPALVKAQGQMKSITKDSTNPHFKSKFASLDGIIETIRPILAANGLAILQGADKAVTDESGALCGFAVETMLLHSSGEYVTNTAVMPLAKVDPQGAGGALTYGRRYGLSALLSLSTEDDDDGNAVTHQTQSAPARTTAPRSNGAAPSSADAANKTMPFGKTKGKRLGDLPDEELSKTLKWCGDTDAEKFKDLMASIRAVLNDRALGIQPKSLADVLAGGDSPLPWEED